MLRFESMKNLPRIVGIVALSFLVCRFPGYGETVSVPNIETRIRNSGNEVPSSALPEFKLPLPQELPPEVKTAEKSKPTVSVGTDPVPVEVPIAPETIATFESSGVTGHASVGSGYPSSLAGEFSVARPAGDAPGLSAQFGYLTSDGYQGKKAGTGYFDRSVGLSLLAFNDTGTKKWFTAVSIADRANGLQGANPAYFSIGHRLAGVNAGFDLFTIGENGPVVSIYFDSQVFTSVVERGATEPLPGTGIEDYRGYFLSPSLRLSLVRERYLFTLESVYALDTVDTTDDLHALSVSAAAERTFGTLFLGGGAEFHTDSQDNFVVPFFLKFGWEPESGLFGPIGVTGGLRTDRRTVFDLVRLDPFVSLEGMPVYAADWFTRVNITVHPLSDITLYSIGEFRRTAANRGTPVLTDSISFGTLQWARVDRDSLVVTAGIAYAGEMLAVVTEYRGELMDELWAKHLHEIEVTVSLHDPAPKHFWATEVSSVFTPDSKELPRIGLSGRIFPLPRLSITLSFDDVLPPLFNEARMRNSLYQERSGTILLSGRFEF